VSALFFLALAVLIGINLYVHARAGRALGLGRRGKWLLAGALVATFAAGLVTRVVRMPVALRAVLGGAALDVELAVLISAGLLLVVDAVLVVVWLGTWVVRRAKARSAMRRGDAERALVPDETPQVSRREMVVRTATGVALAAGVGSTAYGALFGRHDWQLETVSLPVPGLPAALDGFTLVQLSDVHIGTYVGDKELRAAEALARDAHADVLVLTGDLLDHDPRYAPQLARWVRRLATITPGGVLMIPGNHDYYSGVDEVLAAVRAGGGRTLVNEGVVLGDRGARFALLGVDDLWARSEGRGPDLAAAIATVPRELPRVLLAHNPAFFPEAAPHVAVQLSGHTHGGQVNVGDPVTGLVLPYGYVRGVYRRAGATLYVNRGFGTAGPPARVGSPPEVTRVVLTAA
jgi:predicted MPP superfamily phosphohydrolase